MDYLSILYLVTTLVLLLYGFVFIFGKSTYNYWNERGVPNEQPKYPLLGSIEDMLFHKKPIHLIFNEQYKKFKGTRFFGMFMFRKPVLVVKDPELVENMMIKDFSSFYNRGIHADIEVDPIAASLVNLENEQWKCLRNKLSPVFTSGKLKYMYSQVDDCAKKLVNHLESQYKNKPFEAKELMGDFAVNVIASCAFGLNANALEDKNCELKRIGKLAFAPSLNLLTRRAIQSQWPRLIKLLKWRGIPENVEQFFLTSIKQTLEHRKNNNIKRQDFVYLLNELKEKDMELLKTGKATEEDKILIFNDHVVAANAFIFLVGGFETTATALSFTLYELANHQEVQEKVYNEVVSVLDKHSNEVTYEAVKEMTYLSQVVNESLRLYPPFTSTQREVTKDYKIPNSTLMLRKGSLVFTPIFAIHRDPENFPNSEVFDPERFSDENKNKIKIGSYLPFGLGPRVCIAYRFALMEVKLALIRILLRFKLNKNNKTVTPLRFSNHFLILVPEGGLWIDIEKRIL